MGVVGIELSRGSPWLAHLHPMPLPVTQAERKILSFLALLIVLGLLGLALL